MTENASVYMIRNGPEQYATGVYGQYNREGRVWRTLAYVRRHLNSLDYPDSCEVVEFRLNPGSRITLKENFVSARTAARLAEEDPCAYMVRRKSDNRWSSGKGKFTQKGRVWRTVRSVQDAHSGSYNYAGCELLRLGMVLFDVLPISTVQYQDLAPIRHYITAPGAVACGWNGGRPYAAENVTRKPNKVTCPNCTKTKILKEAKKR